MPKGSKKVQSSADPSLARALVPVPPSAAASSNGVSLPKLPLKDIQKANGGGNREGATDKRKASFAPLALRNGDNGGNDQLSGSGRERTKSLMIAGADHSVMVAPDAVSTTIADASSKQRIKTKVKAPLTARADLGYSLIEGTTTSGGGVGGASSSRELSTFHQPKSSLKRPQALPNSSGGDEYGGNTSSALATVTNGGGLGENYVHDLKARMKMIGGVVAKSNRTDPISAWPMALPDARSHNGSSVIQRETTAQGKVTLNPNCRAPLALEIESFVRKEVQNLTRYVPKPSILQLIPIYREAFGCFISHFSEYAPTLSLIQKHYDSAIDSLGILQQKVDKTQTEYHSLKETFHIMVESEKRSLQTQLNDAKIQLAAQTKINNELRVQFTQLEHTLNRVQHDKKERDLEFEDYYDRNRSLASQMREQQAKAAKLLQRNDKLVIENDRLLKHVESLESRLIGGEMIDFTDETAKKRERAKMLQKKSLEAMKSAKSLLGESSRPKAGSPNSPSKDGTHGGADLEDSLNGHASGGKGGKDVAVSEIEMENLNDLRDLLYEKEAENKKFMKANQLLIAEQRAMQQKIDRLQQSKDDDILTPRPRWVTATEALPEFTPNQLQSSDEILGDMISHFKEKLRDDRQTVEMKAYSTTVRQWLSEEGLCEGDLVGKGKNFVCKGTGPHVPVYLRHKGNTKNQRMRKGDVENILSRFWQDRRTRIRADSQLGAQALDEYFYEWLRKETPGHKHAINMAYNILAVCEANQHDPDCSMMLRVLRGEISEMAVFDQLDMVARLKEIVAHHDKQKKGAITRLTFQRILNKFFPAKSIDDMLHLRFALIRFCQGSNVVDYEALFREDEEGNQTKFVELMRTQHMHEIASFVVEVEEAIRERIDPESGTVSIGAARTNVRYVDQAMPLQNLDEMLAYGCKMTKEHLASHGEMFAVEAEPLLQRIRTGVLLKRQSRREEESDSDKNSTDSDEEEEDSSTLDGEGGDGKEGAGDNSDTQSQISKTTSFTSEKQRHKRRKQIEESGLKRAQRQEEIKELLRDLGVDETGEKATDVPAHRRPKISTNEFGEVSVTMPGQTTPTPTNGAGKPDDLIHFAPHHAPKEKQAIPSPFAGKKNSFTTGVGAHGSGASGGDRSSSVVLMEGTGGKGTGGGVETTTLLPVPLTGLSSHNSSRRATTVVEEEKALEKSKRRERAERRANMAEDELADQETKMRTEREKDEGEARDLTQWGSKFGVGEVKVENLKEAKKTREEVERVQASGGTFTGFDNKDNSNNNNGGVSEEEGSPEKKK